MVVIRSAFFLLCFKQAESIQDVAKRMTGCTMSLSPLCLILEDRTCCGYAIFFFFFFWLIAAHSNYRYVLVAVTIIIYKTLEHSQAI